jgi:alkane 1-monooxygenase
MWYSLLPPAFIALIPLGFCFDAPWLGLFMGAVAVPTADAIIGRREAPLTGPSVPEVRVAVVALLAVLIWSLAPVAALDSWLFVVLAGMSSGYVVGVIGMSAAHELGHGRFWTDRFLGQLMLACIGYAHYQVSHNRHHKRAGLREDPATARREESLWTFLPRYFLGIWRDATHVAAHFKGYRRYQAHLLLALSAAILAAITFVFGARGAVYWIVQGVIGLFLIASVDYIQHWGLVRKVLPDGRREAFGPAHTWESPFWLSERITFNMTRHAAHHFSPMTEPGGLSRVPSGPQMPLSYGMMIIIAVWPPLFRSMMEPRHAFVE